MSVGDSWSVELPPSGYSAIPPLRVIRAMAAWLPLDSTNQRLPSGPVTIPRGALSAVGMANSVRVPAGVMRAILLEEASVNQRLPSGPDVMRSGADLESPMPLPAGNWPVTAPSIVNRKIQSWFP